MIKMRNLFAMILSGIVVIIALLAVLGVWGVLPSEVLKHYIWKTIQSIFILLICSGIIYIIYAIFYK
ncbi:MAG: hypothetical protein JNM00_04475, partial [Flavobacteriales bacterium]|nr:hypothetical protein [Flavobacteriales bacterium]